MAMDSLIENKKKKLCLPNRTMRLIKIIKLSILLSLVTFTTHVNSSILFRKIPNPTYYKPQGVDLELPCISEQTNVSCYWLKNSTIVNPFQPGKIKHPGTPHNGDCSLTIFNLEYPKDNAVWTCQVLLKDGSEPTELIPWPHTELIVLVKPSEPRIVFEGLNDWPTADQPTTVSCRSADGNPIPRLEWYLGETNITHHAKSKIDNRTIISTMNYVFQKKDNGSRLTCEAVHPTGRQTTTTILNVQYKPQVSVKQKMYTVTRGSDLEIECHVDANPEARVFWKPAAKVDEQKYKIDKNKLLLRNISHTLDGNEFQCSAQNSVGSSETESVRLNVLYPPRLLEVIYPKKNITVGEDIRFECVFTGNPKPIIRWSFTDFIRNHLFYPEPTPENPGVLIIKNATYLNEGNYYCDGINYNTILNKENILPSTKFTVNVVGKPLFINDRQTVHGYRGLDTKIEQSFCSDPRPEKVYWLYGSNRIEVDTEDVGNPSEEILEHNLDNFHLRTGRLIKIDTLSPNPNCYRVALVVTNTDTEDIRDYSLLVHNKYGKSEGIVTLAVNSPLSIAAVIAFALIILVVVLAITIGIILLRKRPNDKQLDPEVDEKCEVQVPNNDSFDGVQKTKNGH